MKAEGEKEIVLDPAHPRTPGPADITDLQSAAVFEAVKVEVPKLEKSGVSLGAGFEASTTLTHSMEKGVGLSADAKATLDAAYKSPSLLPKKAGDLNFSAGLKGTASAGVDLDNKQTAKATATLKAGATYKTPPLRGPGGTILGILGDKAHLSIGAEGTLTAPPKPTTIRRPRQRIRTSSSASAAPLGSPAPARTSRF